MVHSDPRTKGVLGERQAGFSVALLEAALVPHVVAFRLICKETEMVENINQPMFILNVKLGLAAFIR